MTGPTLALALALVAPTPSSAPETEPPSGQEDPLRAQATGDRSLVAVGDRVRASTSNSAIVGQVTRSDARGIDLVDGGLHLSLAYGELDGLDVSEGIRSRWRLFAASGVCLGRN